MITDLFSHKIHSSGDDWPDKLVELASVFKEFDGQLFNRDLIEERLKRISPRAALTARDPSKFRDEISAYPAYLGLYNLPPSDKGWIIQLSSTANSFLLTEEPDVSAFLLMQLALFQYPNGMGIAYSSHSNKIRIQANARDRTLGFIQSGIHISPLRLIVAGLIADSNIRSNDLLSSRISFEEIFVLVNDKRTNQNASPEVKSVEIVLNEYREGKLLKPHNFERRFHILNHTELFNIHNGSITPKYSENHYEQISIKTKLLSIGNVAYQFNNFDNCKSGSDIEKIILSGSWANYFDGLQTLSGEEIKSLSTNIPIQKPSEITEETITPLPSTYKFRKRNQYTPFNSSTSKGRVFTDPEITRIKRQRRNLYHKILIDQLSNHLKKLGAQPLENQHIDLYAEIPNDGAFIFEIKSGGENYIDQIRKGISQLYEYRFRYKDIVKSSTKLCLVVPENPINIPWLNEYLCVDRQISLCWFDGNGKINYPNECSQDMSSIVGVE